jgi:hypothetical protein
MAGRTDRKKHTPIDLTALDELRLWCVKHGVVRVTVEGLSLELGEAAFWDQPSNAPPAESPPNAPWEAVMDEETPQARIRREHAAKAARMDSGDEVD